MTSDPHDAGVIAKLERAHVLVDQLQAEQRRHRGDDPDPRQYESRSNQKQRSNPAVQMEWRLAEAPDPVPLSFSALLGDLIQNYRASLDYAAWAAATENARKKHPTQVQFPLCTRPKDFNKWIKDRDGWFNSDTVRVLEASQPYHAPKSQMHPLRVLQVLSNTDKHRLLNVVDQAHIDLGIFMDPMPPTYDWWAADGPVAVGESLATLSFPRPFQSGPIDVMPVFGWYESVAFEEPGRPIRWLQIDEMVTAINSLTVDTVGAMSGARLGLKRSTDL